MKGKRGLALVILPCMLLAFPHAAMADHEYGYNDAMDLFIKHRADFDSVVLEISKCKGRGVLSIGSSGIVAKSVGEFPACSNIKTIAKLIHVMDIKWVNVSGNLPYGKVGPMAATFVLSSSGLLTFGHGSAIYYFPQKEINPFGDSTPLDGADGHWFFRAL